MTEGWYQKLLSPAGTRDLSLARELSTEEWRAWLSAHFEGLDPMRSRLDGLDSAAAFAEVWENIPEQAPRSKLTEAILLELNSALKTPEQGADFLAFLLHLMTRLPLLDFPTQTIERAIRAGWSARVLSSDGLPLRAALWQARFARSPMHLELCLPLLEKRETVHLAFRALREHSLARAVEAVPVLLKTLDRPEDLLFLSAHLRSMAEKYAREELLHALEAADLLADPVHGPRLEAALRRAGVHLAPIAHARSSVSSGFNAASMFKPALGTELRGRGAVGSSKENPKHAW